MVKQLLCMLGLTICMQAQAELRDPTLPPVINPVVAADVTGAEVAEEAGWQLTSVLVSPGRRLAVINGQTVRPGDAIGRANVQRIEPGQVTLEVNGETKVIGLVQVGFKTLPDQEKGR